MTPAAIRFCAYDTLCSIVIHHCDGGRPEELLQAGKALALRVQATLNMFDPASELSLICSQYTPGVPLPVSRMLLDFLAANLEIAALTNGAFDPTLAPVVRLWNFGADAPQPPKPAALAAALRQVGWQQLTLDETACTVCFARAGIRLDPGAGGKGFALGLVAELLRAGGVTSAVLDFGGNLYALGAKPGQNREGEAPWKTAVRSPLAPDAILGTLPLQNAGVATSSWYEHGFRQNGRVYHHLLSSKTGLPLPLLVQSMTVVSTSAFYTDLLSTAFFVLGLPACDALAKTLRHKSGEQIEYLAVDENGRQIASPGLCFTPA